MNTIKVRNLEIGTGMPKICVPIVGKTVPEILENAKSAVQAKADVVEWRVDWYEDVFSFECIEHVLRKLCEITGDSAFIHIPYTAGGRRTGNRCGGVQRIE